MAGQYDEKQETGGVAAVPVFVGYWMHRALATAYERAWVDGRGWVDTPYLLEAVVAGRNATGRRVAPLRRHIRSLRGGDPTALRDRDEVAVVVKPGMAGPDRAEDQDESDVATEVSRSLREAAWQASRRLRRRFGETAPEWTHSAVVAVRRALVLARSHGVSHAHRTHLLAAVIADPGSQASVLLADLGLDPALLPHPSAPVIYGMGAETIRQAVRLDDPQVGPVHVLLAICSIERQVQDNGWAFKPHLALRNQAGQQLREGGVTYPSIVEQVRGRSTGSGPVNEHHLTARPWNPPLGIDIAHVQDRAIASATPLGRSGPGTNHFLSELLADHNGQCARLLDDLGVDLAALGSRLR